ncbi:ABC transporter permease subunit [Vibrio palustris]|uniref:Phosphate transport system permease protein PstC n=1 Tax=Vibrio palustris TaxID=1918946 RepID=A0A1R4B8C0_9VIBR|nr:ABC transporter permease subunit [Vibrio palustris]SJL85177.1 Phosphate transport system permease protein PstC [Vibrio palustris]
MIHTDFSLNQRDKQRRWKDRLVRVGVTFGGVGVLGFLVLMFVYLAMVVMPLFSGAKFTPNIYKQTLPIANVWHVDLDDYGKHLLTVSQAGEGQFWSLTSDEPKPLKSVSLLKKPQQLVAMPSDYAWFALLDNHDQVVVAKPTFHYQVTKNGRTFNPGFQQHRYDLTPDSKSTQITQFTFTKTPELVMFASYLSDNSLHVRWKNATDKKFTNFQFPAAFDAVDQLLLTPDGKTLYVRNHNNLIVAEHKKSRFVVREIVDLTKAQPKRQVTDVRLLSGAYSLLVSYDNDEVSQWFDVLKDQVRSLHHIRDFHLAAHSQFLLPDTFSKGFYSFHQDGTVQNHFTTSHKTLFSEKVFEKAPKLASMTNNERYLATYSDNHVVSVSRISNDYPEISWSSLWGKVWYEHYPDPQFVWQSTSASDKFEPKFSLVPIAFGTLKAAAYAMLFAIPIAVFGAIYTAYFMTAKMRRVVKPSIELMEALPTVIIGFLAGLWFAPLVERNLAAIMSLMLALPLTTMIVGYFWSVIIPENMRKRIPGGWHVIILIPAIVLVTWATLSHSQLLEMWMFNGDARVFLMEHGIDFDQRNALVVGFAMAFAVIPTIFTIAEDAVFSVPRHLSDGSLALGATPWQTLTRVILLTASPGIFSGIMMGLGRAVGETMIVLMATGNTPILNWNIFEGMRTLSATIAVELPESEIGSSHYRVLFLAALLLFTFTFAVNSLAEWVRQRLRARYRML